MLKSILLATIAAIFSSGFIILILTNTMIDPYIKATNWGVNLFDFYEDNKETNKIYFIGHSWAYFGVDPLLIEKILSFHNRTFKAYNIAYPSDVPSSRIVELIAIAESKPKIVVILLPSDWLYPSNGLYNVGDYREIRSLLASDKIKLDSYTRSLFNQTELDLIKMDSLHLIAYKRKFLIPSIQLMLYNLCLMKYDPVEDYFNRSDLRPWSYFNRGMMDFKAQFNPGNHTQEKFPSSCPPLSISDNNNQQIVRYIINYLKKSEIHVIIINMPINPYALSQCKSNYSEIFRNFASATGCPYYDLESLCLAGEFRDSAHANFAGRQNITREVAKILRKEAMNVSQ
jgi:hypothetical protein